jgi:hypothetical protein
VRAWADKKWRNLLTSFPIGVERKAVIDEYEMLRLFIRKPRSWQFVLEPFEKAVVTANAADFCGTNLLYCSDYGSVLVSKPTVPPFLFSLELQAN